MRVLQLTNMWPRPDTPARGIFCKRQVDGVAAAGADVDVLSIEGDRSRWNYLRTALRVLTLNFGQRRYDVIHAHTGHCGILAALQLRYPVVVSYVGYDVDVPAEDHENARTKLERLVFRLLALLIAVPIVKAPRSHPRMPRPARRRTRVIPNGIDRTLFAPLDRGEARRRLGWDPGRLVVLFAADPTRYTKDFGLARATIDRLGDSCSNVELAVAYPIPPDEMPLWMNASDALLLTSVAEGSPNVVKEAMACNLPVVSVDVGDVRHVVDGTRHCAVCARDPDELARALAATLAALPERSDGRERTEWLSLEAISLRLLAVYEEAARRGPGVLGFATVRGTAEPRSAALRGGG